MSTVPMDWVQGPWLVQFHSVSIAAYNALCLENREFPHWIISYVKEGNVTTTSGGESHTVRSGDMMLHPPHLPFSEYSVTKGVHLWMHVSIQCAQHLELLQLYRVPPVVTIPEPARYEAAFMRLLTVWDNPGVPFRDLRLTSGMLQLMEHVLSGWEKAGSPERSEAYDSARDRFARLIGHMSVRLHEKLSRGDLAALVSLSPNYLDRAFEREFGLTPMQMLREMRLKRAKQLLEQSEATLEAIADNCGMADASYLCKQYKKQYGMLPGEYRESFRQKRNYNLYG
ncbi:AraC family transcriptional regulator [Paenibacillus contaminans]|uniref:HTH araC/xylS-type domain-containing protein n=1 Tax=Paenibacillus contaminans TaxID=450362 RepID=A0A329M5F9_9BACL|nr:AraC family transcriptional regulator [Paenibacillus contaminans]RAV14872.1 hypothetical protein DQG23_31060 [Paenibacillus contaminans]